MNSADSVGCSNIYGNSTVSMMNRIPVIDISALLDAGSTPAQRLRTSGEVGEACERIGFFYIKNHGVPQDHRDKVLDVTQSFFALPLEQKMEVFIGKSPHFRGYIPLGGEKTQGLKDWHEALDFRTEFSNEHPKCKAGKPLHGPNQWPEVPADFKPALSAHWRYMMHLGERISSAISLSLGLEENAFDGLMDDPFCNMRILHYPVYQGTPDPTVGEGIGAHCDYGFITILEQGDNSGLEVMNADGAWVEAPPVPQTYLVNIGRVTQILTNDRYKATEHRVRKVSTPRYSIPFFYNPNFDAIIQPLDQCCSSRNPPRHSPYRQGEFLAERFGRSFGDNFSAY